jgi:preprotein translocase subunit SecG
MGFLYSAAIFCFLLVSLILCLVILMQEGKGGLGASFGAGEGSDSLFGTATPEILKKFTAWMALTFVGLCLLLSFWTASMSRQQMTTGVQTEISQ